MRNWEVAVEVGSRGPNYKAEWEGIATEVVVEMADLDFLMKEQDVAQTAVSMRLGEADLTATQFRNLWYAGRTKP
eukprot:8786433-Pyramimonas_sp.AAC.2